MAKKSEKPNVVNMKMFKTARESLKEESSRSILPICPSLDFRLNGGIPEGTFALLRTLPKVGKSVLCMQIAANALKQGRYVVYADLERRLLGSKYFQIKGFDLDDPNFLLLQSEENEPPLSGEKAYKTICDMMKMPKYAGSVYIVDSLSKAVPQAILDDPEINASRRDMTPRLNTDFCKKIGNIVRTSRSILVGIQHFHVNTSGYGDKYEATGGNGLIYETDITFDSRHNPFDWNGKRINVTDEEKGLEGQLINFNLVHNKKGAPYISKENPIKTYIKFGEGIWWAREAFDLLPHTGLMIESGKSRYSIILPDGTEIKTHGIDKTVEAIEENREVLEKVIQDYFIEKHKISYGFKKPQLKEDDE